MIRFTVPIQFTVEAGKAYQFSAWYTPGYIPSATLSGQVADIITGPLLKRIEGEAHLDIKVVEITKRTEGESPPPPRR